MSSHVEVSPNGVGFLRVSARKSIPGEPIAAKNARLRSWISGRAETKPVDASSIAPRNSTAK
ncbi:hypothetical protein DOE76_04035 [Leifsonia sp. ku-ls]|nr:hypothetical protein DOE76_04035 [Leifsonia sp. ku-ls]